MIAYNCGVHYLLRNHYRSKCDDAEGVQWGSRLGTKAGVVMKCCGAASARFLWWWWHVIATTEFLVVCGRSSKGQKSEKADLTGMNRLIEKGGLQGNLNEARDGKTNYFK